LPNQATTITTLAELGNAATLAESPAILVIGENVRLAAGLDWLGAALDGRALDPDPLGREKLSNVS